MANIVKKSETISGLQSFNNDAEVTELRTPQEIFNEIQTLESKKSSLRRALCDYNIRQNAERVEALEIELEATKSALRPLYIELHEVKAAITKTIRKETATKPISYQPTEQEQSAILHFNKDRRFAITE